MKARRHCTARACGAMLALALAAIGNAAEPQYSLIDLGTLGGPTSGAFGINLVGEVVGTSTAADAHLRAFFWDDGITQIAPLPGDLQAHALAVNVHGVVVGASYDLGELAPHGLAWLDGVSAYLGDFAPRAINPSGVIVGDLRVFTPGAGWNEHAARWSAGTLADLGTLGGRSSHAFGVSDDGWVVGTSTTASSDAPHACLWIDGAPADLGTLGGVGAQAYAINAAREIVGWSNTSGGATHAVLYEVSPAGVVTARMDLGSLPGDYSYAYGINNPGQVVGTSAARACTWVAGVAHDLNDAIAPGSGWRLDAAWGINDAGRIVGVGRFEGFPRAFLLVPADCPDLDGDGAVNLADLSILLTNFGVASGMQFEDGDLDGDGDVDLADLSALLERFGVSC